MKKLLAILCLSVASIIGGLPVLAVAGVLKVWPTQCTAYGMTSMADTMNFNAQNYVALSSTFNAVALYACEIRLPVGATITQISMSSSSENDSGVANATIQQKPFGPGVLYIGGVDAWGPHVAAWKSKNLSPQHRVAEGYKYYVDVRITDAYVYAIKITYR